ncbi:MAG: DHH family phosphoesterase [Candidatus Aenigmatarchaeota archaeon]
MFVEDIGEEKVALVYDTDVDGVVSAALILIVFKKMGKKIKKSIPMGFGDIERLKTRLKRFEKIITVDVPIDLIEKHLLDIEKKMLIIDHHPGKDLTSEKIILINPRMESPKIYQPTSYVVYKMFKNLLKDKKWAAAVGTVGDLGVENCKDLVKINSKKNIWKSKFGKAAMLLGASISVLGPEKTLQILLNSRNLEELVKNKKMISASKKFDQELERCEKEFEKNLESYGRILVSKIKPRYRGVCSALITKLSIENPENIIFVFEDKKNIIRIHGRNGSGEVDVGKLFRELKIGGGHEKAGAGNIDKKDEEKLKSEILSKLTVFMDKKVI